MCFTGDVNARIQLFAGDKDCYRGKSLDLSPVVLEARARTSRQRFYSKNLEMRRHLLTRRTIK